MVSLRVVFAMAASLCCAAAQTSTSESSDETAAASSTISGSSAASTASNGPTVHRINVGAAGGHIYDPDVTHAAIGDIITFVFYPTNHSVVRGEYTESEVCGSGGCNPCIPYDLIHQSGGFNSTNMLTQSLPPANSISASTQTYNITVGDENPIWFYCTAIDSCANNGMVGVINPGPTQDIKKQISAAVHAPFQLAPGEAWPAEGASVGAETASVSGIGPTSTPTSSATSSGANGNDDSHHSLSGGAIAGIAIGGVAVLLLAGALFYFVGRSKAYKDAYHGKSEGSPSNAGDMAKSEQIQQWMPPPGAPTSASGYTDNRYSYQTQTPMLNHQDGTFLGYNRHTGAPEFAAEAPMQRPGHQSWMSHQSYHSHGSPNIRQSGFQPPHQSPGQTFEMAGDAPRVEMHSSK